MGMSFRKRPSWHQNGAELAGAELAKVRVVHDSCRAHSVIRDLSTFSRGQVCITMGPSTPHNHFLSLQSYIQSITVDRQYIQYTVALLPGAI